MHVKNFDPYDFSKKEIEGVPVYYKNLPWAPCIHIRINFDTGAFNDPVGKEGLAHFLEHIIGNGSPTIPDKKAMKEFSRLYMLNSKNAMTFFHWTAYVGKCLPEHFPKVLEAMRDYVFNPFIRPEDIEHERNVITQEAWERYKNDKFLNYVKEYSENLYHGHERSRISSPLGWPETIARITQKDVADFHKANYVKENLSIFLVGAIDEKDLETLGEFMRDIPTGNKAKINSGKVSKPKEARFERNSDDIGSPQEQVELSIFRVLDNMTEEENETIDQTKMLLYDILFERLRLENSLCYGVSLYLQRFRDFAEFGVSVNTGEDKLALVEKEIWNVVDEIDSGKWEERFNTLHALSLDQIRSRERLSSDVMKGASDDLAVNGRIVTLGEILKDAEKVTYKDIQKMVKQIFEKEYIFTEVILPSKKS